MKGVPRVLLTVLLLLALVALPTVTANAAGVSVTFLDTSLQRALHEAAKQAGVNIVVADEVEGTVNVHSSDTAFPQLLDMLLVHTEYQWEERDGVYLVGSPGNPMFSKVQETRFFYPQYLPIWDLMTEIQMYPVTVVANEEQGVMVLVGAASVLDAAQATLEWHDSPENFRQVGFQLEIIEITDRRAAAIGLLEASVALPSPTETFFSILADPSVLSLVTSIGLASLRWEAHNEDSQEVRISTPEIIAALKTTAVMRVVQEETRRIDDTNRFLDTVSGLEISLTAAHINRETQEILTQISMGSPQRAQLETEVWLKPGEYKLIAVLEQQIDQHLARNLYQRMGKERRYLAVYASARPLRLAPSEPLVQPSGSLGGLDDLLWPAILPQVELEGNFAELGISPGSDWQGRAKVGAWVTDRARVEGSAVVGSDETWVWLGAEGRLFKEDTRVGTRITYTDADGVRLSVGVSDRHEVEPGVIVLAGVHPIVFGLSDRAFELPLWWVEVRLQEEKTGAHFRAGNEGASTRWELGFSYVVTRELLAFASFQSGFESGSGRFWVGVRWEF